MKTLLILALLPIACFGQTGIISTSRASTNWPNAGTTGGIPVRNTICTTVSSGVSPSTLNSDIASCPSGDVVFMNAGTYNFSSGIIMKSSVTLRGAGANSTFIVFTGDTACNGEGADICVMGENTGSGSSWVQPGGTQAGTWSGGYSQGATTLTFSNMGSAGISNGQYIYLDQSNLNADNGSFFVCDNTTYPCSLEGGAPGRNISGTDYNQIQIVKIVSGCPCSGAGPFTITISPGLEGTNWSSSLNPGNWWPVGQMTGAGIENLSLDHTSSNEESGIMFFNAFDDWVSGVRSLNANRNHIWLWQSAHITVQNSYFYGTLNAMSQSYGVESFISSDNLVVNNIFQHITASLMSGPSIGSAFVYNFGVNDYYNVTDYLQQMIFVGHDAGVEYNLWEGNEGTGFDGDVFHGTSGLNTIFRNRASGWEPGKTNGTAAVELMAYNRDDNFIGNVLGQPSYTTNYQLQLGAGTAATVYDLGAGDTEGSVTIPNDSLVASTLMRWGNYDVKTGGVRWCGNSSDTGWSSTCGSTSEVPTRLSTYANPVPTLGDTGAGQSAMPASFWSASKPSWWPSAKPWPVLGPDVSGGNMGLCSGGTYAGVAATSSGQCTGGTLATAYAGHVNTIPAMDCFLTTMSGPPDGSGSALTFNASSCYTSSSVSAPGTPTLFLATPP